MSKTNKIPNKIVNLSDYNCIYSRNDYLILYRKFLKELIPKNIKKSKTPVCKIYMGPPGSGKSFLASKNKDFVNINTDYIISQLPEIVKLNKLLKSSNMIESCNDIGDQITEDIENFCIQNKFNFSVEISNGPNIDFMYYLKENDYQIKSYYVYSFKAYENNIKRKNLNLSKKVYLSVLDTLSDYKNIYIAFNCSDSFKFISYDKITIPKNWGDVKKKLDKIIKRIKINIR